MCYFSVVIPVYNAELYINRCVESILRQQFSDYEIILVNDQSSDSSLKICEELSNKYDNIYAYDLKHCGASQARNYGIVKARGEYIVFVDADDYLQEEMLLQLYNDINVQKPDVCYMGKHYVEANNQKNVNNIIKQEKLLDGKSVSKDVFFEKIVKSRSGIPGSMWLIVVNRSFLLNNKIEINSEYVWSEDSDFSYNVMVHAKNISLCDYPGYIWCVDNANSVSKNVNIEKVISRMNVYKKWYYIFGNICNQDEVKAYVCEYMLKNYCSCLYNYSWLKRQRDRKVVRKKILEDNLWKKCVNSEYQVFYKYGLGLGSLIYRYKTYLEKIINYANVLGGRK